MSQREHDPLTPEEHELQQRLARLGAGAEPSTALDARILAAARAPTTNSGARGRRETRHDKPMRWPVGLGLAASLTLAVGIAWQLRPLPVTQVQYSEVPSAVISRPREAPPFNAVADAAESGAAAASNDADASAPGQADQGRDPVARRQAVPPQKPAPEPAVSPPPKPAVHSAAKAAQLDEHAPSPGAPAAAPSPPPPPAQAARAAFPPPKTPASGPVPQSTTPSGMAAPASAPNTRERKSTLNRPDAFGGNAAVRADAEALDRVEVTGSRINRDQAREASDSGFDEAPPASVDSPAVRAAWLARIRELVVDGHFDAARESVREFHRRYPRAELPDDLRPLLD